MAVVAFIVLTERLGMRLYPVGSAAWRRVLIPIAGSLAMGFLLFRYFPNARGSGVPQTKAALFARDGFISLRTVLGKFFLHGDDAGQRDFRWAARGRPFRLVRESARCSAARSD